MRNIKLILILMAAAFFLPSKSWASLGCEVNGNPQSCGGNAIGINFTGPTGTSITQTYGYLNVPTLSTNLVETGVANGGAASMATSDANDLASFMQYAMVKKALTSATGFTAGTLPNGTPGQLFTIQTVAGSGTYVITPTTSFGWSTLTFNAVGQSVTWLYLDTTHGWIIESADSLTGGSAPTITDAGGQ